MAMIRHSSKMDRPIKRENPNTLTDVKPLEERCESPDTFFCFFSFKDVTVEHVGLGVGETQPAGLLEVGRFDGRLGRGDATQTQHLLRTKSKLHLPQLGVYGGGDKKQQQVRRSHQQHVQ